jgi:hypothetical protein
MEIKKPQVKVVFFPDVDVHAHGPQSRAVASAAHKIGVPFHEFLWQERESRWTIRNKKMNRSEFFDSPLGQLLDF